MFEIVVSGTCTSYVGKGTSVRKRVTKNIGLTLDPPDHFRSHFASKLRSKNHIKNDLQKALNLMPKGSQNRAEIDAETHQKSMPKLVMEKIMKIIKNHVSLNVKIIEIHCKNKCFG